MHHCQAPQLAGPHAQILCQIETFEINHVFMTRLEAVVSNIDVQCVSISCCIMACYILSQFHVLPPVTVAGNAWVEWTSCQFLILRR